MNFKLLLTIAAISLFSLNAEAKKCDCIWKISPANTDFSLSNLVWWNYTVAQWNDIIPKDRMGDCISACHAHLQNNPALALSKMCSSYALPWNNYKSSVQYRVGVQAATKPAIGNYNYQSSGPWKYSGYIKKNLGPNNSATTGKICAYQ